MSNFDIIVAVDIDAVISSGQYSTIDTIPTQVKTASDKFIHMLTYQGGSVIDNGGIKLTLNSVSVGKDILWKTVSLSPEDSDYSIVLTSFKPVNIMGSAEYLSKAELLTGKKAAPMAMKGDNGIIQITPGLADYSYWHSSILKNPMPSYTMDYDVYFTICQKGISVAYSKYSHKLILKIGS
ncbi:inclusion body family protein [Xenorhabdus bovienii]|uniref:AidA/PixA family protein n=1 Tax=Xenorhabdus bovienii TaxID=40576 RepID=UPI0023B2843F|nr:hypothetical protein [Xenorhabdus bovienii]MDE9447824.1 inclusion body family protein [Xenorhabdus bovienii]